MKSMSKMPTGYCEMFRVGKNFYLIDVKLLKQKYQLITSVTDGRVSQLLIKITA